jgi:hypothetical protein
MIRHPIRNNHRYVVARMNCGPDGVRFVAMLDGRQIGARASYPAAALLCIGHDQRSRGALVIEAKEA